MTAYDLGQLLAIPLFVVLVVCAIAGIRWVTSRDADRAKATFRLWWPWAIGVVLVVLSRMAQAAEEVGGR